ncbi:MAG: YggS family pyridoxal phosphate-dependent enzyme [Candidatus Pelagibacter sp. TMED286]|nr:MAG: YggS family pyridoxal phosphate-dependent enzyme [Candidatus Pelagibacter sp. TMED286]
MDHTISNLLRIKEEINLKESQNAKIIAVTKTFSEEKILPLVKYGHIDFGENKVQEALLKWSPIKNNYKDIKLHMIGKLQTNKVKHAVKIFDYIHSIDNLKLAEKISQEQKKINKNLKLFIQINVGNEKQKSGINFDEAKNFLKICRENFDLNIIGLMCLPPNDEEPDKYFSEMVHLKNQLNINNLSMGMSSDYLIAVKHGSTFVRIGSRIFGSRN